MTNDTVSTEASDHCPNCGSSNWVMQEADGIELHAKREVRLGERACNNCGHVWDPIGGLFHRKARFWERRADQIDGWRRRPPATLLFTSGKLIRAAPD